MLLFFFLSSNVAHFPVKFFKITDNCDYDWPPIKVPFYSCDSSIRPTAEKLLIIQCLLRVHNVRVQLGLMHRDVMQSQSDHT